MIIRPARQRFAPFCKNIHADKTTAAGLQFVRFDHLSAQETWLVHSIRGAAVGTIMRDKAQPGTQTRDQARTSPETSSLRFSWNVPSAQERPLGFCVPAASWMTLLQHVVGCVVMCASVHLMRQLMSSLLFQWEPIKLYLNR